MKVQKNERLEQGKEEREMDRERKNGQRTKEKKIVREEDINTNIAIVLE